MERNQSVRNQPFTWQQVEALKPGFTSSGWGPNRKARREHKQKKFNNPNHGFPVHHYQVALTADKKGIKFIGHLSSHAAKGNWR